MPPLIYVERSEVLKLQVTEGSSPLEMILWTQNEHKVSEDIVLCNKNQFIEKRTFK
jgi:hypothetical protein